MSFGFDLARIRRMEAAGLTPEDVTDPEAMKKVPPSDPFLDNVDMMQALMFLGIAKLSKTPEGMKVLDHLGTEFMKGTFRTLAFLAQASAANPVAAWANPILISGVLQRFGFLPPKFNTNFHLGITVISGVEIYSDIIKDVADALPWNLFKGAPEIQYPQSLTFAETGDGIPIPGV